MGCGERTDAHGRHAEKAELVAVARSHTRQTLHSWCEAELASSLPFHGCGLVHE
jgi:hypothetical protein